ncbi:transposase [Streptomyces werraensis]|uniref:transposase n=1 Tax=Streptomyces werraensis TaxID=68284 RepID=UPI003F4E09C1
MPLAGELTSSLISRAADRYGLPAAGVLRLWTCRNSPARNDRGGVRADAEVVINEAGRGVLAELCGVEPAVLARALPGFTVDDPKISTGPAPAPAGMVPSRAASGGLERGRCLGEAAPAAEQAAVEEPAGLVPGGDRFLPRTGRTQKPESGPSPVDHARPGSRHHVITDGQGIPLAVSLTGGNHSDVTRLMPLLDRIPAVAGVVGRPRRRPDMLFADRGYDHAKYRRLLRQRGIRPMIGTLAWKFQTGAQWGAAAGEVRQAGRGVPTVSPKATAHRWCDPPDVWDGIRRPAAALFTRSRGVSRLRRIR